MLDVSNMPIKAKASKKKPVQISLDRTLLKQIDEQTGQRSRSAFITQAILLLLRIKREKDLDQQLRAAYEGKADELWAEVKPWIEEQVWSPDDDLVEDPKASSHRQMSRG